MCSSGSGMSLAKKGLGMKSSRLLRLAFLLLTASCLCAAQTYTMTDLGTLAAGGWSVGRGINATGQVTGASGSSSSPTAYVFVYSKGTMTSLGTLGGNTGIGNGINSSGQAAGYSTKASGTYRAFISNGTSLTDIGDLGGGSAVAYAINDAGQVVGSAVTADGSNHPFLYSNGQMIDLGTLGSPKGGAWWNSAEGINNHGVVTGYGYTADSGLSGFTWSNGKMTAVGSLGGNWTEAYAINNKGQVTGISANKNGDNHAFITDASGHLRDLGAFGKFGTSWGFAINDSGVVVGQATTTSAGYIAFVYSGGKMKNLNNLISTRAGWTMYEARGINNAGQIACSGMRSDGAQHAFLLTPR